MAMRYSIKVRRIPGRVATGSYILDSGLSILSAEDQAAAKLHGMATGSYPALKRVDPKLFTAILAVDLTGLYLRTPGMRQQGSLRPAEDGLALAKDVWMLGIAAGLLADVVTTR